MNTLHEVTNERRIVYELKNPTMKPPPVGFQPQRDPPEQGVAVSARGRWAE